MKEKIFCRVLGIWCVCAWAFSLVDWLHAKKHIVGIYFSDNVAVDAFIKIIIYFPALLAFILFIDKTSSHAVND